MSAPWIYGAMSREESEKIMKEGHASDGDFLVRLRDPGSADYILVLIFKGKPTHHLMHKNEQGQWTINKKVYVEEGTIEGVIAALKKPVQGWPIVLQTGIVIDTEDVERLLGRKPTGGNASSNDTANAAAQEAERKAKADAEAVQAQRQAQRQAEADAEAKRQATAAATARREQEEHDAANRRKAEADAEARRAASAAATAQPQRHAGSQGSDEQMNRAAAEVSRLEVSLADAERKFTAAARPRPAPADNPDDPPYIWASFLTRDEAEAKIAGTSDGTFLIRKRKEKDNQYIMALVFKGKPTHHLIEMINGVWTVNKKPYGSFTILSELITALGRPMKEWPVQLYHPIEDPSKSGQGGVDEAAKGAAEAELRRVEAQLKEARNALAAATCAKKEQDQAKETQAATAVVVPSQTQSQTQSETEAQTRAQAQAEADTQAQAQRQQQAQAEAEAQAQAQRQQQAQQQARAQAQAQQAAQAQPVTNVAASYNADNQPLMTRPPPAAAVSNSVAPPAATWTGTSDPSMPMAGAASPDGKLQTYDILGRRGFADFINGQYVEQDGTFYDSHAVFKRTYTTDDGYAQPTSKDLFLFFHAENGAWAISHYMGARGIVSYVNSRADRPSDIRGVWKVTTRDGHFVADDNVRVELSTPGMSAFRRSLQSGHEINFFQYRLSASQVADLCDELRSPNCRISRLKLYLNYLQPSQVKQIIAAHAHNKSVTHLQLRENNISDSIAEELARVLGDNTTLRMVSLRANKIGDEGAKWLAEAIRRNKTLEGLSLRGNQITDAGAEYLADALKVNSALRGLSIYDNNLKPSAARKLQRRIFKYNTIVDFAIRDPMMVQH